jgi:hypothetical protein
VSSLRLALGTIVLCSLAPACGYSTGLSVSERYHSIGIAVFGNDSYERDLERPLYDEISRAIRNYADAPIVDPEHADVVVRGTIKTYHRRPGIRSPENKLLETAVIVDVEAGLYKRGSDAPLHGVIHAPGSVGYVVGPTQNEQDARNRDLRLIAERLVLDLFAPMN